jgi:hypothetical protein
MRCQRARAVIGVALHSPGQPESFGKAPRERRVLLDHPVHLAMPAPGELDTGSG